MIKEINYELLYLNLEISLRYKVNIVNGFYNNLDREFLIIMRNIDTFLLKK
jgi:hypothetical protein